MAMERCDTSRSGVPYDRRRCVNDGNNGANASGPRALAKEITESAASSKQTFTDPDKGKYP